MLSRALPQSGQGSPKTVINVPADYPTIQGAIASIKNGHAGYSSNTAKFLSKEGAFLKIKVLSPTSVLILDKKNVKIKNHCHHH